MRAKVKVIDTTCAFSAADGPTDGGGGATRERGSENVKVASSCAPKRDGGESALPPQRLGMARAKLIHCRVFTCGQ